MVGSGLMVHLTQSHPVRPADLPPVQLAGLGKRGETEWSSRCDLKTTIMGATFMDLESLAMDLGRLEMDRDSSDLVFVVGQDEAKVSGHAAIFSVRCTKFVDLVSNNNTNITASRSQGLTTLNLNFVSSEAFIKFVHYVYTGQMEVSASLALYDLISVSSLFGLDSLTKWCSDQINNKLNPRNAQRLLNEAAAISDRIPNKNPIIKSLLQWVGDNIQTLTDRNLLEDLDISALVLLGTLWRS